MKVFLIIFLDDERIRNRAYEQWIRILEAQKPSGKHVKVQGV